MKKFLFLIAAAIAVGLTSCSDDDCDHGNYAKESQEKIFGSWYNESENEECSFNSDGSYNGRISNFEKCISVSGRWEYDDDNNKLSFNYSDTWNTVYGDWTVKNMTELGLTLYSTTKETKLLEKIVEEYTLSVGENATIAFEKNYPAYTVLSYTSDNSRIVSVSTSGELKAEGEKGVTYVKITTSTINVWVKVTVGNNSSDLWYDYVSLIDKDYTGVRKALNSLGEPINNAEANSYAFYQQYHSTIDSTTVFIDKESGLTTKVQLTLKSSAAEAAILAYMNARYYKLNDDDAYVYYTTQETMDASKAVIVYSKGDKKVTIIDREYYLSQGKVEDLWLDFTAYFECNKETVNSAMTSVGYDFSFSDYSYSKYGADYYYISDNEYISLVAFVYNSDYKMSEIWAYSYSISTKGQEMYDYLKEKYTRQKDEDETGKNVFYNEDKSIRIVLDQVNSAIIYTNMNMKQDYGTSDDSFGSYNESIGKTKEEIISIYGIPYVNNGNSLYYIPDNANLSYVVFTLSESTGSCYAVSLILKDDVEASSVVKSFSTNYTVYEKGTLSDGSQYGWIDGTSLENSSIGILYYVEDKIISYVLLSANKNSASAIKRTLKLTK